MEGGAQLPLGLFCSIAAKGLLAQLPLGLNASLLLMPQGHFISFPRRKETKQRKFAVCTFCATPALFCAKQKELASLKQLFVFHAPKSTSASRPKSEAGPYRFFLQHRFARWGVMFSFFAPLIFLLSRAELSVVKDLVYIHTTSEAMCPPRRATPASVEER